MSDWKQDAAKRRDARATKTEETSPGKGKSKNTKRWCRGKVGVEHNAACQTYQEVQGERMYPSGWKPSFLDWRYLVCTTCGRRLDFYLPSSWSKKPENRPAWVTS